MMYLFIYVTVSFSDQASFHSRRVCLTLMRHYNGSPRKRRMFSMFDFDVVTW